MAAMAGISMPLSSSFSTNWCPCSVGNFELKTYMRKTTTTTTTTTNKNKMNKFILKKKEHNKTKNKNQCLKSEFGR